MPIATSGDTRKVVIKPVHIKGAPSLIFSSIITEFADNWTSGWTTANVYGRMDPIPFYSGTRRDLTLGFRVISDSHLEANANMVKIQRLIQYQYPVYESRKANIIKAPPYFKFQFMNIVGNMPIGMLEGYINGPIQISPGFQSKEQSQYFSSDSGKIYFSDVNIILKIQVMHYSDIRKSAGRQQGEVYPYGLEVDQARTSAQAQDNRNISTNSRGAELSAAEKKILQPKFPSDASGKMAAGAKMLPAPLEGDTVRF